MNETQGNVGYQDPAYQANNRPVGQLKTNRSLLVTILLSLVTFGIYSIVNFCGVANDLNILASRYDGKRTMHFALLVFIIAPLTLGIGAIVWWHSICTRMEAELRRRNIAYSFSASDYWLWNVLGSLIIVGPFVFMHKFFTASNMLNQHFNYNG